MNLATSILVGAGVLAIVVFVLLIKDTITQSQHDQLSEKLSSPILRSSQESHSRLLKLVKFQNATIAQLERALESVGGKGALEKAKSLDHPPCPVLSTVDATIGVDVSPKGLTRHEQECEQRYGMSLVNEWRKNKEVWCDSPESQLTCYPYHQMHKKRDGRASDLFCEATNIVVDFSKISGTHGASKPSLGMQYLNFQPGSISSECHKTNRYQPRLFMPHHRSQMATFSSDTRTAHDQVEETTTYLLSRDEDCENSFHSTADFVSI